MHPADFVRRVVDVVAAAVGMVLLAPLFIAVAAAVRVTLGGPVLHRQVRLGRGGHRFELLKFRTMRHAREGREDPVYDAERITRLGRLLRSTSIDELPSLVNLLRGEIALVGPRPLPAHYWPYYRDEEYLRFVVRPGLTGLAQVSGRNALGWDERLALDVDYVRSRTLLGDARIAARTIPVLLGGGGVDQPGGVTMTALSAERPSS